MAIDTSLFGKKIEDLTPQELASLSSQVAAISAQLMARTDAVKKEKESVEFTVIAECAKGAMTNLAWQKLPKLQLVPKEDGTGYVVSYMAEKKAKAPGATGETGKRATPTTDSGKITINKIGIAMGGIERFVVAGQKYESIKDAVRNLKQPGTQLSEADRCWDISKKGIAASDIITRYHPDEVTLIFTDMTEMLVKDAVSKMEAARKVETPAAPPAETPAPAAPAAAAPTQAS